MAYQGNVFNHITDVSTHILGGVQIQSLNVQSTSQQLWSDANLLLTERQISDPIAKLGPDGITWVICSSEYEEQQDDIEKYGSCTNENLNAIVKEQQKIVADLNTVHDADSMNKFVADTFSDPAYLDAVSSAFMVTIMGLLNEDDMWDSSTSPTTMTTLNNVASLVSSNAQYEEQIGESDVNMLNSLIQQTANSSQTITTCNEQVMAAFTNWISLMNKF